MSKLHIPGMTNEVDLQQVMEREAAMKMVVQNLIMSQAVSIFGALVADYISNESSIPDFEKLREFAKTSAGLPPVMAEAFGLVKLTVETKENEESQT